MTRRIILAFVALCVFVGSRAEFRYNYCPEIEPMKNFNLTLLEGRWYVVKEYSTHDWTAVDCETYDFINGIEGHAAVQHGQLNALRTESSTSNFNIRSDESSKPGKLRSNFWAGDEWFDVLVIKTDYVSWAVLYVCVESDDEIGQFTYILTRERNPNLRTYAVSESFISRAGVSRAYSKKIFHIGCAYPPIPH